MIEKAAMNSRIWRRNAVLPIVVHKVSQSLIRRVNRI